jgi:integrase
MANLHKRNGVFHYDFTIKGIRKRGSTGLKDKYLAGLYVNDLITKARTAGIQSLLRESPVLKDFAVEFLQWVEDTHSIEHETRRYYKNGWRLLKDTVLAEKRMDTINNHMCETITFPGGPANANTALRTLRRMFSKAKEMSRFWGDLPEFGLRKEESRNRAMTIEEANLVASKMADGDAKDAFLLLRFTGMRPQECFSMRWEYVHWQTKLYINPGGKTSAARRWVPLLYDAVPILEIRHSVQGTPSQGWVFPAESGTGHMMTIHKAFTKARNAAGLPKEVVLYTTRHGHLTDLGAALSLQEVMRIGGHSDAKTALKYQHPSFEDIMRRLQAAKVGSIQ